MREVQELTDEVLENLSQLAMIFSDYFRDSETSQKVVLLINERQIHVIETRKQHPANVNLAKVLHSQHMLIQAKAEQNASAIAEGKLTPLELVTTHQNLLA